MFVLMMIDVLKHFLRLQILLNLLLSPILRDWINDLRFFRWSVKREGLGLGIVYLFQVLPDILAVA